MSLNPILRPNLDREAITFILDGVKDKDGFAATKFIAANAGSVIEALMWIEAEGHLDQ